jgi:hypothetical protein
MVGEDVLAGQGRTQGGFREADGEMEILDAMAQFVLLDY